MQRTIAKNTHPTLIDRLPDGETLHEYVVAAGAHLTLVVLLLHRLKAQARLVVRMVEPGAGATIIGVILGDQQATLGLRTLQSHEAPRTTSNLLVKSVLRDNAHFIFDGMIRVEKTAQKTEACQRNENLLLSDSSRVQTKPILEILANDVRCTHAATVGGLPREQLWYLAARGVGRETATSLIVSGFLKDAFRIAPDQAGIQPVVVQIQNQL